MECVLKSEAARLMFEGGLFLFVNEICVRDIPLQLSTYSL